MFAQLAAQLALVLHNTYSILPYMYVWFSNGLVGSYQHNTILVLCSACEHLTGLPANIPCPATHVSMLAIGLVWPYYTV